LQFVFASLVVLFFMLMIRELTGNPALFGNVTVNTVTGIVGVICGLSAVYLAVAEVLNEAHARTVLPIGTIQ
jgi:succinate-acetate transporter protein